MNKLNICRWIRRYRKTSALLLAVIFIAAFSAVQAKAYRFSQDNSSEKTMIFPKLYCRQNGFIYYESLYDNNIYKIKLNGNDKIKIGMDRAEESGIILWGDWIYYLSSGDEGGLYKIKTDGTNKTKVGSCKLDMDSDPFFIWNNHMYYYDLNSYIHKVDISGREVTKVSDVELNAVAKLNIHSKIVDDWIYTCNDDNITKTNIESGESFVIDKDRVYSDIEVIENWIYYINSDDLRLYRITTDGKNKMKLSDDEVISEGADYDTGGFSIAEDSIYYTSNEKGKSVLYKSNLDGSKKTVAVKDAVYFIIMGEYIYYIDSVDNGSLYRVRLDGSDKKKITSESFIPYIDADNGFVIYGTKSNAIGEPYWGRLFVIDSNHGEEIELK